MSRCQRVDRFTVNGSGLRENLPGGDFWEDDFDDSNEEPEFGTGLGWHGGPINMAFGPQSDGGYLCAPKGFTDDGMRRDAGRYIPPGVVGPGPWGSCYRSHLWGLQCRDPQPEACDRRPFTVGSGRSDVVVEDYPGQEEQRMRARGAREIFPGIWHDPCVGRDDGECSRIHGGTPGPCHPILDAEGRLHQPWEGREAPGRREAQPDWCDPLRVELEGMRVMELFRRASRMARDGLIDDDKVSLAMYSDYPKEALVSVVLFYSTDSGTGSGKLPPRDGPPTQHPGDPFTVGGSAGVPAPGAGALPRLGADACSRICLDLDGVGCDQNTCAERSEALIEESYRLSHGSTSNIDSDHRVMDGEQGCMWDETERGSPGGPCRRRPLLSGDGLDCSVASGGGLESQRGDQEAVQARCEEKPNCTWQDGACTPSCIGVRQPVGRDACVYPEICVNGECAAAPRHTAQGTPLPEPETEARGRDAHCTVDRPWDCSFTIPVDGVQATAPEGTQCIEPCKMRGGAYGPDGWCNTSTQPRMWGACAPDTVVYR